MGTPCRLSAPNPRGAYPDRASENNIREVTYRLALAAESAAVSTTKFMMKPAAGIPGHGKDGNEWAFGNAGTVPRHHAHQHGHCADVDKCEGGKGDARGPRDLRGRAGFAGGDRHHFNAQKTIKPEGGRHHRTEPALGSKAAVRNVLRLHLAAQQQRRPGHDENKDRDHLDHGEPIFEGAVVAHGKKIDRNQKEPEDVTIQTTTGTPGNQTRM